MVNPPPGYATVLDIPFIQFSLIHLLFAHLFLNGKIDIQGGCIQGRRQDFSSRGAKKLPGGARVYQ